MATILELAELSSAVYGDTPVPSGWKQIQVSGPASDGYLGVAYVAHAVPKALQIDAVVRLGASPLAAVPAGPELHPVHGTPLGVLS